MKTSLMIAMVLMLGFAAMAQQPKALTADPLTGQPLTPASISGFGTNEPTKMPDGHVCSSKMQGNFYMLFHATVDATVSWYDSHLSGFKKSQGKDRTQTAFYNSDGTIVLFVTASEGQTDAYSVAYERYTPGLPEKAIVGMTQGHIVCK